MHLDALPPFPPPQTDARYVFVSGCAITSVLFPTPAGMGRGGLSKIDVDSGFQVHRSMSAGWGGITTDVGIVLLQWFNIRLRICSRTRVASSLTRGGGALERELRSRAARESLSPALSRARANP